MPEQLQSQQPDFANPEQETEEDRAVVTELTGVNMNLTTQVAEYANHTSTKDYAMATMHKKISYPQGGIKTLKSKLAGYPTKKPEDTSNKNSTGGLTHTSRRMDSAATTENTVS